MKRRARIAQAVVVLGLFAAADLAADPITPHGVIDQAFDPRVDPIAIFEVNLCCVNSVLQTFTAGTSGIFSGFELLINRNPAFSPETGLTVALWAFDRLPVSGADTPTGAPLLTTTISPSMFANGINWAGADVLTPHIRINAGGHYGLQVMAFEPVGPYRWVGNRPGYPAGHSFGWQPGLRLSPLPDEIDFSFRTYVVPDPVPEPATVGLLALGLGAVVRRRVGQGRKARKLTR